MKLKIRKKPGLEGKKTYSGRDYQYWIDDIEVTDLAALRLDISAEDLIARTSVTFLVDDVDIDQEALTDLATLVQVRDAEEEDEVEFTPTQFEGAPGWKAVRGSITAIAATKEEAKDFLVKIESQKAGRAVPHPAGVKPAVDGPTEAERDDR